MAPGSVWQATLKKIEVKLELLTDIGMLLMFEKGIRGGICYAIHRYKDSNEGYIFEVDIHYLEKLYELHNYLPFLPKRMKFEKVEKLVTNLHDKTEYIIHIRNFKASIKSWINFGKSS